MATLHPFVGNEDNMARRFEWSRVKRERNWYDAYSEITRTEEYEVIELRLGGEVIGELTRADMAERICRAMNMELAAEVRP